jgi:hypothetical protein
MSVSFNSEEYQSSFKPFPNGWVTAQITDFGDNENKARTGELAWFEFTVLDGSEKGRTLRQFYSYIHSNEDTQRISREQICALARAAGVRDIVLPERMRDFENKKLKIRVEQKKGDDYPTIKEYEPLAQLGFSDLEDSSTHPSRDRDPYAV